MKIHFRVWMTSVIKQKVPNCNRKLIGPERERSEIGRCEDIPKGHGLYFFAQR